MVSTLDFESSDPSSNLGGTYIFKILILYYIISKLRNNILLFFESFTYVAFIALNDLKKTAVQ